MPGKNWKFTKRHWKHVFANVEEFVEWKKTFKGSYTAFMEMQSGIVFVIY